MNPSVKTSFSISLSSVGGKNTPSLFSCMLVLALIFLPVTSRAQVESQGNSYVSETKSKNSFALSVSGKSAPLYFSSNEYPGVIRAIHSLKTDIGRVVKVEPDCIADSALKGKTVVIIGTIGKSLLINRLIHERKINCENVQGRWETYLIQTIDKPFPGVEKALVIAGSDKRGTIYGVYDLSAQIGVSPWYWWADVPVREKKNLYIKSGRYTSGEPAVKYRGFFINDEAPALSNWVHEKYGTFNHVFYERVFELLLRLKANFLWPAMWNNAFNDDDKLNPELADEYGIVMSTSHHEPMLRAQQEWKRYGSGEWNYEKNDSVLREFWRNGIRHMGTHESIITLGMRGDGDMPMSEGSNITLLEKIVKDQRDILRQVTGKDPASTPQVWALYKEVQDYYDKGMRVPDDVTLLLCDDNWGNIRRLPRADEKQRPGGYGIYYHFDYVGGPRNYKWLNTNPIPRIWEQMHLAYQYGVDRIWIVNVGDIKPMEFPIQFFLDYAWNPDRWSAENLPGYTLMWAKQQFGEKFAPAIAHLLTQYTKYNGRRKPELLSPQTYSLFHYREAETVVNDYAALETEAEKLYATIPLSYRDAFYQLVLHPIEACANLNKLYFFAAKNRWYASQGRNTTNDMADSVEALFRKDAEISYYYNKVMSGGKWNHMMDQTHIGYTYWQQPPKDVMPEVKTISLPAVAALGVAVEGSDACWPNDSVLAELPAFDRYNRQSRFIELFNKGSLPAGYAVETPVSWIRLSSREGRVEKELRLWVDIDWDRVPAGTQRVPITIRSSGGKEITVFAKIENPLFPNPANTKGFYETGGYVSMEAAHFTKAAETNSVKWQVIPDLGRTLSGITPFPVNARSQTPANDSPHLEYQIFLTDSGKMKVHTYFSPTLNFTATAGLRFGISVDDGSPEIVNVHADDSQNKWDKEVSDNINEITSGLTILHPGVHILKFWMIDPGLVLQKIVVDAGGMESSYLGPPESYQSK